MSDARQTGSDRFMGVYQFRAAGRREEERWARGFQFTRSDIELPRRGRVKRKCWRIDARTISICASGRDRRHLSLVPEAERALFAFAGFGFRGFRVVRRGLIGIGGRLVGIGG